MLPYSFFAFPVLNAFSSDMKLDKDLIIHWKIIVII